MQQPEFLTAKNGSPTCKIGSVYIHSAYNPQREAERFADSVDPSFIPAYIVIIEPALSYCVQPLRSRFPKAKLLAVRFSTVFSSSDIYWDKVFNCTEETVSSFSEMLFSYIGEEGLSAAYFADWKPAVQSYPQLHDLVWQQIKSAAAKGRDVLATRAFYAKIWLRNTVRFCLSVRKTVQFSLGSKPILFVASGPSLKPSIPLIHQYRSDFFIIAASSAYEPLVFADIIPDACISTDGGFWAKKHIVTCAVPLIVSAESAVPNQAIRNVPFVPLLYGDGPETILLTACGIPAYNARRNGTVSGTAVELALNLTAGSVYACGLDLCTSKGYQHTQPNRLETDDSLTDWRIVPISSRTVSRELSGASLSLYRQWFCDNSRRLSHRFSRLFTALPESTLGQIPDITWQTYAKHTTTHISEPVKTYHDIPLDTSERKEKLLSVFDSVKKLIQKPDTQEAKIWLAALCPADYLVYQRDKDKNKYKIQMIEKAASVITEIETYLTYCANGIDK